MVTERAQIGAPASVIRLEDHLPGQTRQAAEGSKGTAVLFDFENIRWSLLNKYGATPNLASLVDTCRSLGRVLVMRAYADWTQPALRTDVLNLYRGGIKLVLVPGRAVADGAPPKNAADHELVADAFELCLSRQIIDQFVLVTGDAGFLPAVHFLKSYGKSVAVIGVGATMAAPLRAAADTVVIYERDIEVLPRPAAACNGYAPVSNEAKENLETLVDRVFGAVPVAEARI